MVTTRTAAARGLEFNLVRQADKIRIVLVFFLIVVSVAARDSFLAVSAPAYLAIALAALVSAWSYFFLPWDELLVRGRLPLAAILLTLFDIAWLTILIVTTGGFHSPFWALLLLAVVFAATFFSSAPTAFLLTALVVGMVYVVLAIISPGLGMPAVWELCGRLLVVIAVAWLAWTLSAAVERERAANDRIVRYLTAGALLVNREGTILLVNPQMSKLCGLAAEDITGKNIFELDDGPGWAVVDRMVENVRKRPLQLLTSEIALEGGHTTDLRCSTVPCGMVRGQALGWIVVAQDLTDIKAMTRMKEKGLGMLSHELRSPLASLQVIAQVLSGMAGDLSDKERERAAATIEREAGRLSRLVANLLDLAQIEQPHYQVKTKPISSNEIANSVADLFSAQAEERGITLRNEVPPHLPPMRGNADRVAQILTNLVDNALKYTPSGGEVRVGARADSDWLEMWVTDTGNGIAPEALELIFEKFGRAPTGEEPPSQRGVGLGLYVARLLASKHGGNLHVSSKLGEGSTFTLELPLYQSDEVALGHGKAASQAV